MSGRGRMLRLGFDIDGVLANFVNGFLGLVNVACCKNYQPGDWTDYGGKDGPAFMLPEQWHKGWAYVSKTPDFWARLEPLPGTDFDLLDRQMDAMEYHGFFFTKRMNLDQASEGVQDAAWQTRTWLNMQGLNNYTSLTCTKSGDRVAQLKAMEIDAYIDDWGDQFLKVLDAGIDAYLIDRPYNREVITDKRVTSVHEFVSRAIARFNVPAFGDCLNPLVTKVINVPAGTNTVTVQEYKPAPAILF